MAKSRAEKSEKKLVSRREFLVGSGAVMAAIALTACGSKTTNSTTTIPTSAASTPLKQTSILPSTSTLTPKYGGTLKKIESTVTGAGGWPANQDFFLSNSAGPQTCLEGLLRMDNKGNITPWLAESYKLADDMKSITFALRKEVKFHDGTDLNAQVAKWNLDNGISAKSVPQWTSVDVIDNYTIRVNFTQWSNTIWSTFSEDPYSWMVSPTAFQKNGLEWMKNNPVGTGPFKFISCVPDVNYKVIRNQNYWKKDAQGNQLPYLDGMEIICVVDSFTSKLAFETGQGDTLDAATPDTTVAELKTLGFIVEVTLPSTINIIPDAANTDSPYSKKQVREAVEYAIDREAIAKAFSYGYWQATYQIPGPDSTAYNPNFTLGRKYDPEKAKQLLDEVGFTGNPRFKTSITSTLSAIDQNIVEAIQANLSDVGIQANILSPENIGAWLDQQNSVHSLLNIMPIPGYPANFSAGINSQLGPNGITNKNWLRTDEFLNLLNVSLASPTYDANLMRAVTDYLVQEALLIPIGAGGNSIIRYPYVMDGGWFERSVAAFAKPEQAWLNK